MLLLARLALKVAEILSPCSNHIENSIKDDMEKNKLAANDYAHKIVTGIQLLE